MKHVNRKKNLFAKKFSLSARLAFAALCVLAFAGLVRFVSIIGA